MTRGEGSLKLCVSATGYDSVYVILYPLAFLVSCHVRFD